jgi:hypothetical protein
MALSLKDFHILIVIDFNKLKNIYNIITQTIIYLEPSISSIFVYMCDEIKLIMEFTKGDNLSQFWYTSTSFGMV